MPGEPFATFRSWRVDVSLRQRTKFAWVGFWVVLLVLFALFNRGQVISLSLGVVRFQVDAVTAIYAGVLGGLFAMLLLSLPIDLAARREREALSRRVRELERPDFRPAPDPPPTHDPPED